ncbi:MAG: alginate lyase family protein [Chloroflexota bacterium]
MSGAITKLKKLRGRSPAELKARAAQAFAAFTERRGWSRRTRVPRDAAFLALLDPALTGRGPCTAADLLAHFRTRTAPTFCAAFTAPDTTRAELRHRFGAQAASSLRARARALNEGKFDLLGQYALDFGMPVDWHLEPMSGGRAPRTHWSRIDFLDAHVAGDKKFTWELNRCQHFMTLGRAYWHTGDEACAETFAAQVTSWMDANPPAQGINWASSLEVSLRAIAWLWALYFFKDAAALTPALFLRLLKFLSAHARHIETYLSTYFAPNTHLTGEALGLYYLGTLLPEFKRAARWRALGQSILLAQLDRHVLPDGVYFERSTYYQRYTADFYTHFLLLAQANDLALPTDARHKLEAKLTALLDHLMYITRPDGTTPYVGDDDGGQLAPLDDRPPADFRATLAMGAAIFARGDYKFVADDAPESLLWLLGARGLQSYDALAAHAPATTSRAFPDGGYYVMRDGWTSDANYMLLDAGPHGAPTLNYGHAHADALAFDLAAHGRTLLVDPGTYTYTGASELRDHFRNSQTHNTLTVDGASSSVPAGPFRWQQVAHARIRAWHSQPRFDYCAAAHDGYTRLAGHEGYERAVLFLKHDYWIMRDRVQATGTHHYDLNFHFAPDVAPLIETNDGTPAVRVTADGESALTLFTFCHNGAWHKEQGWVSNCYGARASAPVCRYTAEGAGPQEFVTFVLPAHVAAGAQMRRPSAASANGYELCHAAGRDVLLTCTQSSVGVERLVSDFEWTWARFTRDGSIVELVLIGGGRNCLLDGQAIIESATPVAYAVARRVGAELLIETDAARRRIVINDSYAIVSQ